MLQPFSINPSFLQRSKRSITHGSLRFVRDARPVGQNERRPRRAAIRSRLKSCSGAELDGPGQATRISVNALALSSFIRLINWRAGVGGGEEDTAGFYDTREFTANFQQYSQLGLNGLAQIVTAPIINRSPPFNARNSPRISNNISADGRRVSFDPRTNSLVLVRRAKEMDK